MVFSNNFCRELGGKPVEIDSAEEERALVTEINRRGYTEENVNFCTLLIINDEKLEDVKENNTNSITS